MNNNSALVIDLAKKYFKYIGLIPGTHVGYHGIFVRMNK